MDSTDESTIFKTLDGFTLAQPGHLQYAVEQEGGKVLLTLLARRLAAATLSTWAAAACAAASSSPVSRCSARTACHNVTTVTDHTTFPNVLSRLS